MPFMSSHYALYLYLLYFLLLCVQASESDSGNYSCSVPGYISTALSIQILDSEAADQTELILLEKTSFQNVQQIKIRKKKI